MSTMEAQVAFRVIPDARPVAVVLEEDVAAADGPAALVPAQYDSDTADDDL
jgi:hypothetical protein